MNDELEKDLEGKGGGIIEVLYRHLSEGTEGNHKKPQSRQLVSLPRFEPNTCTIVV
jgi:hypothetical protein